MPWLLSESRGIPSLMKICDGFGITLAQFFSEEDETAKLKKDQRDCLDRWNELDQRSQELALAYMEGLADRQKKESIDD